MCIAADVPLIESGTTGFNGQVQPIRRGLTQCYDCEPKETPKTFPVCTIRSTPSQPIHCIVWAKSYLFNELFGVSDEGELDHTEDSDNASEIETLRQEAAALKKIRMAIGSDDFPRKVFEKVYTQDIERLRTMEDMWKTRKPPVALDFDKVLPEATAVADDIATQDQKIWNLAENVAVFSASLQRLSNRLQESKTDTTPIVLSFDKDDKDTLDFVAAAANLRSIVFDIETRSEFDIKQMAGNIIPAIATTNANTAALCVLKAFKIMQNNLQKAGMVFLTRSTDRMIAKEHIRPPAPDCPICSTAQAKLAVDTTKVTLQILVEELLKAKLGYTDEISITTDAGVIYDPDMEENLSKTLSELGILKDTFITVRDEEEEHTKVNLVLVIADLDPETDPEFTYALVPPAIIVPLKAKPVNGDGVPENTKAAVQLPTGRKRGADEAELDVEQVAKRGKVAEEPNGHGTNGHGGNDKVISIDDNGVIELD